MGRKEYLKELAEKTRQRRDESFLASAVLKTTREPDLEQEVVSLNLPELVSRVEKGKLTATDLVRVFAHRCAAYGGPNGVNAITEQFFDEAAEKAESFQHSGHLRSELLRGIPISVKDCIGKAGALQTGGLSCRCEEKFRSKEDSVIVDVLQRAGAIVIARGT